MTKKLTDMPLSRSVFLFDYFEQSTSEEVVKRLIALDQASSDPIYLFINSYGGSVYSLFAMMDTISNIKAEVNTICLGEADSCGAVLLSMGKERFIGQRSRLMIHEVSSFTWGKISEMIEDLERVKEVNEKIVGILAENSSLTAEQLSEIIKKDTFMNAEEAIEVGLVDSILNDTNLEEEETDVFNFVNSFSGHMRDRNLALAMCNKRGGGTPERKENVKDILNQHFNRKKGDTSMTLKQLLADLKSEHNVDVAALQDSVKTLTDTAAAAETRAVTAEKELATYKADNESQQIEDLLSSLIDEGKSTQDLNDSVYRVAFNAAGLKAAKEMANALQLLDIKQKRSSTETDGAETAEGTDAQTTALDKGIKAYMKENNIDNYAVAAEQYIAVLDKKGENA